MYETTDAFVAALAKLYRDPTPDSLDATFTDEGLDEAIAFDWRLRGAVRGETNHFGELSVRGGSFDTEAPTADPPTFDVDLSIVIAPGAELVDARTRALVQQWNDRQLFSMHVVFEYDLVGDRWQAASIGPATPESFDAAPTLAPAVRCEGLSGNRPDRSDPERSRRWCFGGSDGTQAKSDVVNVIGDYPCGESRASIMTVGWPIGSPIDRWDDYHYVRDPDGRFEREDRLPIAYLPRTRLPKDGYSTGLTDGEFEIWVSPRMGPRAIWAKRTDTIERWPRVVDPWLVIDCN